MNIVCKNMCIRERERVIISYFMKGVISILEAFWSDLRSQEINVYKAKYKEASATELQVLNQCGMTSNKEVSFFRDFILFF